MSRDCMDHGCTKSLDRFGYARKWYRGKLRYAHRIVYALANGLDVDSITGIIIRHTCDNPRCINPQHLVAGSQKDNMLDMVLRNKQAVGERAARHKLTVEEVNHIRTVYTPRHPKYSAKALAALYNVSPTQIGNIIHRKQRRQG